MKVLRSVLAFALLSSSVSVAGCGGADDADDAGAIDSNDIVDLGDLATSDPDEAAAAEQIGDPAVLLGLARGAAEKARADVAAVFDAMKEATAGEPARRGTNRAGDPYAIWESSIAGVDVRFSAIRRTQDRVRYLLQGKSDDGAYKPLLTGIFIKKGPRTGGGRFHVSLTNASDLWGAPNVDGSLHFWFANHKADMRGRRILYVNVKDRSAPGAVETNHGADLVRLVGVGGRLRVLGVGPDIAPELPGNELLATRVQWKTGAGGRAAAVVTSLATPRSPTVLWTAHECWDAGGLRTYYRDTDSTNDATNPDGGDPMSCAGLQEEDAPTDAATPAGVDADPELDSLLDDVGASNISGQDADQAEEPGS